MSPSTAPAIIYAAAVGSKPDRPAGSAQHASLFRRRPSRPPQPEHRRTESGPTIQLAPASPPVPAVPSRFLADRKVYRIGTDNFPQRIWQQPQDIVYALGFDPQGRPIVGTGNKGNIYRIDSDLVSTLLINAVSDAGDRFCGGPEGPTVCGDRQRRQGIPDRSGTGKPG